MNHITIYNPNKLHQAGLQNERGLEAALALEFMTKYLGDFNSFIEVGATSPYYYNVFHSIVDPYDKYEKCIRMDAEQYDFTNKNVMCISTIEHMGRRDYDETTELDPQKPMRFLTKLNKEASHYLVTFPIGSNQELDQYIKEDWYNYNIEIYHRICYNPPLWEHIIEQDIDRFNSIKYNEPCPNGNGIVVIRK